jgi:hypothetical protein
VKFFTRFRVSFGQDNIGSLNSAGKLFGFPHQPFTLSKTITTSSNGR